MCVSTATAAGLSFIMVCVYAVLHHVLLSSAVVLLVSSAVARASSYMRAHGAKVSELMPHFRNTCNLTCPYGFMTDVEGNYVCLCHDPCQNVRCFRGTQCVVVLPKVCRGEYCRPSATCKDMNFPMPTTTPAPKHGVLQADDAGTTSTETSLPQRCLLPLADDAKKCGKTRIRWSFDRLTGTCKQFMGCRVPGNNFSGARGCYKTCVSNKTAAQKKRPRSNKTRQVAQPSIMAPSLKRRLLRKQPAVCSMTAVPVSTGCQKVRKRWFFDQASGTCRKFRSCPTVGNSFRKKRHCKKRCLRRKTLRRKGRRHVLRSATHAQ